MSEYNREYYLDRGRASRAMAAAATRADIAAIHLKLAEQYDAIAESKPAGDAVAPPSDPAAWGPALRVAAG